MMEEGMEVEDYVNAIQAMDEKTWRKKQKCISVFVITNRICIDLTYDKQKNIYSVVRSRATGDDPIYSQRILETIFASDDYEKARDEAVFQARFHASMMKANSEVSVYL